jgi:hypothetical protein
MLVDLKYAEYFDNYKIRLLFEDGKEGIVDFSSYSKKAVFLINLKI